MSYTPAKLPRRYRRLNDKCWKIIVPIKTPTLTSFMRLFRITQIKINQINSTVSLFSDLRFLLKAIYVVVYWLVWKVEWLREWQRQRQDTGLSTAACTGALARSWTGSRPGGNHVWYGMPRWQLNLGITIPAQLCSLSFLNFKVSATHIILYVYVYI